MRLSLLAFAAGALFSGQALADQTGTTFQVTAAVAKSCRVTATDLAFGTYDPVATADTTATGTVTVKCTKNTTADVALSLGANGLAAGGTCASPVRQMANGTERLTYAIYQDGAGTDWGCDATNDQAVTADVGPSAPEVLTTYGVIPAGQDAPVGNYADTVSVTVTF